MTMGGHESMISEEWIDLLLPVLVRALDGRTTSPVISCFLLFHFWKLETVESFAIYTL